MSNRIPVAPRVLQDLQLAERATRLLGGAGERIQLWQAYAVAQTDPGILKAEVERVASGREPGGTNRILQSKLRDVRRESGPLVESLRAALPASLPLLSDATALELAFVFILSSPPARDTVVRWIKNPSGSREEAARLLRTMGRIVESYHGALAKAKDVQPPAPPLEEKPAPEAKQAEGEVDPETFLQEKLEAARKAREESKTRWTARERVEAERLARAKADAERSAGGKAEVEEHALEEVEVEWIGREDLEAGQAVLEEAGPEDAARERAEAERVAREQAEIERVTREQAEAEREAREKAEADRIAHEKAEAERIAREKAEAERRVRDKEEAQRLARGTADALLSPEESAARDRARADLRASMAGLLTNPWRDQNLGAWYRVKSAGPGGETYKDVGLRERGAGFIVLGVQEHIGGRTEWERWDRFEHRSAELLGQEVLDLGGTSCECDVYQVTSRSGREKVWLVLDGPYAGAPVKSESPGASFLARTVEKETVQVGTKSFECARMEGEETVGGKKAGVVRWWSSLYPLGPVKSASDATPTAAVSAGANWNNRPPFPS